MPQRPERGHPSDGRGRPGDGVVEEDRRQVELLRFGHGGLADDVHGGRLPPRPGTAPIGTGPERAPGGPRRVGAEPGMDLVDERIILRGAPRTGRSGPDRDIGPDPLTVAAQRMPQRRRVRSPQVRGLAQRLGPRAGIGGQSQEGDRTIQQIQPTGQDRPVPDPLDEDSRVNPSPAVGRRPSIGAGCRSIAPGDRPGSSGMESQQVALGNLGLDRHRPARDPARHQRGDRQGEIIENADGRSFGPLPERARPRLEVVGPESAETRDAVQQPLELIGVGRALDDGRADGDQLIEVLDRHDRPVGVQPRRFDLGERDHGDLAAAPLQDFDGRRDARPLGQPGVEGLGPGQQAVDRPFGVDARGGNRLRADPGCDPRSAAKARPSRREPAAARPARRRCDRPGARSGRAPLPARPATRGPARPPRPRRRDGRSRRLDARPVPPARVRRGRFPWCGRAGAGPTDSTRRRGSSRPASSRLPRTLRAKATVDGLRLASSPR